MDASVRIRVPQHKECKASADREKERERKRDLYDGNLQRERKRERKKESGGLRKLQERYCCKDHQRYGWPHHRVTCARNVGFGQFPSNPSPPDEDEAR